MSHITGINHITFATRNRAMAIEFYCEILGAKLVVTWNTGAYLLLGDLWLCLSDDENTKQCPHKEYTHIAFNISDKDFNALEQRVNKSSLTIWKKNKSEGKSLYLLDPDFNKLEIYASNLSARLRSMIEKPYPGMVINDEIIKDLNFFVNENH